MRPARALASRKALHKSAMDAPGGVVGLGAGGIRRGRDEARLSNSGQQLHDGGSDLLERGQR